MNTNLFENMVAWPPAASDMYEAEYAPEHSIYGGDTLSTHTAFN